jgi:adenosylhomocysteine nucleosidase
MTILLVGALEAEVAPVIRAANAREVERRLRQPVYRGHIGAHEVLIAEAGIGKVRAAAVLQSLIERHTVSEAICFGSAGGLNPELGPGDLVVARQVTQHDYALISRPSILGGRNEWLKTHDGLSKRLLAAGLRLGKPIRMGSIITGDAVVVTGQARHALWEAFHADCVEMEGAAIGLVCELNGIPFTVIRGLTDNADEQAVLSFKARIREVAEAVAEVVVECIQKEETYVTGLH